MTPWCIRDRSARYDYGPEAWGSPRVDGYFRDDNSIIKKLPLPLRVRSLHFAPYDNRNPWRGFTACHIWREVEGGVLGGEDPWIYSFMPNLVWLPTIISSLTDYNTHVKDLLKRTSLSFYGDGPPGELERFTTYAWGLLLVDDPTAGRTLDITRMSTFEVDERFVQRRITYMNKIIKGVDEILETGALGSKLVCSRYTEQLPHLDRHRLISFRDALREYSEAVVIGMNY